MTSELFTRDDQEMLTLAAASYRGFHLGSGAANDIELRKLTDDALQLEPLAGRWKIEWGPARFNAALLGFDDAAAFIARSTSAPVRFAIVVRGTNPISFFDWLLGDLVVTRRVPWPLARPDDDARISFSTALGLSLIQHLRWQPHTAAAVTGPWMTFRDELEKRAQTSLADGIDRLPLLLRPAARLTRAALARALAALNQARSAVTPASFDELADRARQRLTQTATSAVLGALNDTLTTLEGTQIDPLQLVLRGTTLQSGLGSGVTLQQYLRVALAELPRPVPIHVSGHSKGGALSPAVALWLAETQGQAVAEDARWDPESKAVLHTHCFAGPTPGNQRFATRFDQALGDRCRRVVNRLDVVPCAWTPAGLQSVATLYDLSKDQRDTLKVLTDQIVISVGKPEYCHIGGTEIPLPGNPTPAGTPFPSQLIHQHLDGYFEQMNLPLHALDFFLQPAAQGG